MRVTRIGRFASAHTPKPLNHCSTEALNAFDSMSKTACEKVDARLAEPATTVGSRRDAVLGWEKSGRCGDERSENFMLAGLVGRGSSPGHSAALPIASNEERP